jgi:hypothetical protein
MPEMPRAYVPSAPPDGNDTRSVTKWRPVGLGEEGAPIAAGFRKGPGRASALTSVYTANGGWPVPTLRLTRTGRAAASSKPEEAPVRNAHRLVVPNGVGARHYDR